MIRYRLYQSTEHRDCNEIQQMKETTDVQEFPAGPYLLYARTQKGVQTHTRWVKL